MATGDWKQASCTCPYFLKKTQMQAYTWSGHSTQVGKASTCIQGHPDWPETQTRPTEKIEQSFAYRLTDEIDLFCLIN